MFPSDYSRAPANPIFSWTPALPDPAPKPSPQLTLADMDAHFLRFHGYAEGVLGHSPVTLRGYRDAYRRYRAFLLSTDRPNEKLFAIEEWIAWNRLRPAYEERVRAEGTTEIRMLKHITINTYWRALRSFFHHLEKTMGIANPFRGMKPPTISTHRKPKALEPDECRRILLAVANIPWRNAFEQTRAVAVLACFLYGGLRRGELLKLNFKDVSLTAKTISITGAKGVGDGNERTVYIGTRLRESLIPYMWERENLAIEIPGFFASSFAGQPNVTRRRAAERMSLSTLRRIQLRVQRASGVKFSLHSLRHSFVTTLLRSGKPIHDVAAAAGHSNIRTTMLYSRVFDGDVRRAMDDIAY